MKQYDIVVIGGGPGGTPVAIEYGKLNRDKTVALIDASGELGGECLFQGCIPSKIMETSAKALKSIDKLKQLGVDIDATHSQIVWKKIVERKNAILSKRSNAAKDVVQELSNIDFITSQAKFIGENRLRLDDGTHVMFGKAIVATGSHSFIPKYDGNGHDKIITNSEFFADMELPESLSIIGSGAIAIELAQILSGLGVPITLFVRGDKILKNIDSEAASFLTQKLQEDPNIKLLFNANIKKVDFEGDAFTITFSQDGLEHTMVSQRVLSAAGRVANIEGLGLEDGGVQYSQKGIIANKHMQTSNPNIYANGDVVENFPKFAHTAQYGAHTIAQNLFLERNMFSVNFDKNAWVLFSNPNIAMAGISQAEAKARELDVIVDRFEFATEAKSQIVGEAYGYLKFVVDKSSKKIIGISIMHEDAHILAGEASLIVSSGLKLKDIIDSIHPHPTISESFLMLAKQMMGKIMLEKLDNKVVQTLLKIERWI